MIAGYSLILWDFDGTLCDTFGAIEASLVGSGITDPNEVLFLMDCFNNGATLSQGFTLLLANRYQKDSADLTAIGATLLNPTLLNSTLLNSTLFNSTLLNSEVEHLCRRYREAYPVFGREHEMLFSDTLSTLEGLHTKGIKQIIVSNKTENEVILATQRFGLAKYFCAVLGFRTDMPHKPDPNVFEKRITPLLSNLFQQTSLHRQKILMVGDTPVDIQFGNAIGCDTVLIKRSKFTESEIFCSPERYPTIMINELNELITGL